MSNKVKKALDYVRKEKPLPIFVDKSKGTLLEGKVAFVTGASGGIGGAIAKKVVEAGGKVVLGGRNKEKLERSKSGLGENAQLVVMEMTEVAKFEKVLKDAVDCFGKIDILVNAAGMHVDREGLSFLNTTEEEYDQVMETNLKGTYFLSQVFAKYFIEQKIRGHILMISSQLALEPSWSPYRLSKRGIEGITQGLAQELLHYGITVNGIGPGSTATAMLHYAKGADIATDLNPIGRLVMPEEIAEYAVMLMSELGNTIVGDTLYMSGGGGITALR